MECPGRRRAAHSVHDVRFAAEQTSEPTTSMSAKCHNRIWWPT